ncbi:MAG: PQQ-binding-like beta-propeller repeat protein [Planctomycetota bacterium]|jgi:hypothetical protein|nr:PQQ-binding-like beta-propeller repeat protein [Planctomycetota bacterium]MDP7249823.1 PQQ-binding-like beta-propeller repeat protein [Planctomycetota bacterium]
MTPHGLFPAIVLLAGAAISGQAQEKPKSWGWRGDGSGVYPEATPPIAWSHKSKELQGLSCQAEKPNPDSKRARSDLSDGVIKEWLVLGPFDAKGADKAKPFASFQFKNEAGLAPAPGDMTDGKAWKTIETIGSFIEPALVFKQDMLEKAACFYTNIHSAEDAEIYLNTRTRWWSKANSLEVWLNGTKLSGHPPVVKFKKGWNRLLMKVISTAVRPEKDEGKDLQPNFGVLLWTANKQAEYITENIVWKTPLPQDLKAWGRRWSSASQPVIAGDRVFATAEPQTLTCFDRDTGKILWMRSVNFRDVATAEEREKKAKYFTEIDPLNRRVKELDRLADTRALTPEEITEKASADKELFKLTFKVNPKKYYKVSIQEGGMSAPTPVTDGKRIYVYYGGSGIVACYDLGGTRQWIYHLPAPAAHHCYASSPCIVDGKLLFLGGQKGKQYDRIRTLVSLDCITGKELIQEDIGTGSPIASSLMPGKFAGRDVLAMRGLLDPKTGKTICRIDYMQGIPSPIFIGEKVFFVSGAWGRWSKNPFSYLEFPNGDLNKPRRTIIPFTTEDEYLKYPGRFNDALSLICSPIHHEGLVYFTRPDGLLFVIDVVANQIVYMKYLQTNWWTDGQRGQDSASLTMDGKHLYYFDISGTCIIFKPGRKYEEVARNRIEQATPLGYINNFKSTPIIDGERIYLKAEDHLYCIGKK